jgi:hypothetical protein
VGTRRHGSAFLTLCLSSELRNQVRRVGGFRSSAVSDFTAEELPVSLAAVRQHLTVSNSFCQMKKTCR